MLRIEITSEWIRYSTEVVGSSSNEVIYFF
jgi:hypothetical protein